MRGVRWKSLPAHVKPARTEDQPGFDTVFASWDKPEDKARKSRPFRLTPPKERERPQQRSITKHLNAVIIDGGAFHIANESALAHVKEPGLRATIWRGLMADGVLLGAPDDIVMWRATPDQILPFVGFLEIKRPGWSLSGDKRWREGAQPKAHEWLASFGAPVAIVRDVFEAEEAVLSWGVRLRYRLTTNAGGDRQLSD